MVVKGKVLREKGNLEGYPRIKLVDIELEDLLEDIEGLKGYSGLQALVRLQGTPVGYIQLPVTGTRCRARDLEKALLEQLGDSLIYHFLCKVLATRLPSESAEMLEPAPLVTVVVCTRDRTASLEFCLKALLQLDYPALDLLVIDNAPSDDTTARLVEAFPTVRYVREPRPGLNWARNRAILEARGEIVAYTDDDVLVDPGWVRALVNIFIEEPTVAAVTGLVVPYELETRAQVLFEEYGGFGRGFKRKWFRVNPRDKWIYHGAGQFGTGANMAYRRTVFDKIGYFDPALDVGTVTNGGGDLEMFFRVLKEGYALVYEPNAIVRHRHRRDYSKLREQIANNGIGFYSYLVRTALTYPEERYTCLRLGLWWLWWWNIRRWLISLVHPDRFPRDLIEAELKGSLLGLARYQRARPIASRIEDTFGSLTPTTSPERQSLSRVSLPHEAIAVRTIDLDESIQPLTDVQDYTSVRFYITKGDRLLGHADIPVNDQSISSLRLFEAIVNSLGPRLLAYYDERTRLSQHRVIQTLVQQYQSISAAEEHPSARLSYNVSVSIVVATYDRPEELRCCLRSLTVQETSRDVEIIVVDNHPLSHVTSDVVAQFPQVRLINEPRKGLAYARNVGIAASKGDIIITTDDDVIAPSDWLEKLIMPFERAEVKAVTGNVLPLELETTAQRLFEVYGGLGRGFERKEVDGEWFKSFRVFAVPTWHLGATANAAFHTSIFRDPEIGLLDVALGAGTATGCSEDTYLFYKVLKAGYTIIYEPSAYVWHKHRRDMPDLRHQIYNYGKGHVAYHLTTLLRDHDLRVLLHLFVFMPPGRVWQVIRHLIRLCRGTSKYPLSLRLTEIIGNLVGPWALWQSCRRVKHTRKESCSIPILNTPT
ncbi:MAG: glycosyltransferase [Chloroflexota bacterium]|nr:glycosyltransferase [Chloroflexota bacterium]